MTCKCIWSCHCLYLGPWQTVSWVKTWCATGERWFSWDKSFINNIFFTDFQLSRWPLLLCVVLFFRSTVTYTQKTEMFCVTTLLTEQKIHHLQVNTYHPFVMAVVNMFYNLFNGIVFFFQYFWMADRYWCILVGITE